eukprot:TRINITY_DN2431_c1_g1_i2.p1 TRINITY_DN2431_c1_g1~~TRINITY_DN2431_c1_g1_i2.p1  ORF type:complete len:777 (+),score=325.53 TRINITY_DN2431_c1_g1_i2:32-2362(+)
MLQRVRSKSTAVEVAGSNSTANTNTNVTPPPPTTITPASTSASASTSTSTSTSQANLQGTIGRKTNRGQSILHEIVRAGDIEKLREVLKKNSNAGLFSKLFNLTGATSISSTSSNAIERASLVETQDEEGQTLLHVAAFTGNISILRMLLTQFKANIQAVDRHKFTALHWALMGQNKQNAILIAKELLDRGTYITDRTVDFNLPLHYFMNTEDDGSSLYLTVLQQLTPREANEFDLPNKSGMTALHCACLNCRERAVIWLLKCGASPRALSRRMEETALHAAVRGGSISIVRLLLNTDVPKYWQGKDGTARQIAEKFNKSEIIELFNFFDVKDKTDKSEKSENTLSLTNSSLEFKFTFASQDTETKVLNVKNIINTRTNSKPNLLERQKSVRGTAPLRVVLANSIKDVNEKETQTELLNTSAILRQSQGTMRVPGTPTQMRSSKDRSLNSSSGSNANASLNSSRGIPSVPSDLKLSSCFRLPSVYGFPKFNENNLLASSGSILTLSAIFDKALLESEKLDKESNIELLEPIITKSKKYRIRCYKVKFANKIMIADCINIDDATDCSKIIKMFNEEFELVKAFEHPNLINYVKIINDNDKEIQILKEYLENFTTLTKMISDKGPQFSEKLATFLIFQVMQGLQYLHQNQLIHESLNPECILVDDKGLVKITDYIRCITLVEKQARIIESDACLSPYYTAPEVLMGETDITYVVDVWSLGCIVTELLQGQPPYSEYDEAAAVFQIIEDNGPPIPKELGLSPECVLFLEKCLEREPSKN